MDLSEFEDLVDRYGDDISVWPQDRRGAARALVARSAEARALVDAEAELRRLFARQPRIAAPSDLAARILARAEPPPASPPSPPSPPRRSSPPPRAPRARAAVAAAAFAACFLAGVVLGTAVAGPEAGSAARQSAQVGGLNLFAPLVR